MLENRYNWSFWHREIGRLGQDVLVAKGLLGRRHSRDAPFPWDRAGARHASCGTEGALGATKAHPGHEMIRLYTLIRAKPTACPSDIYLSVSSSTTSEFLWLKCSEIESKHWRSWKMFRCFGCMFSRVDSAVATSAYE